MAEFIESFPLETRTAFISVLIALIGAWVSIEVIVSKLRERNRANTLKKERAMAAEALRNAGRLRKHRCW